MEGGIGEAASAAGRFVLGCAVGGEVAGGALEEEGEDFEVDGAEGEDVCFLGVVRLVLSVGGFGG